MLMVTKVVAHCPIIPIGPLDEYGIGLLDAMLAGKRHTINEIVEFFKNYEPQPGRSFNTKAFKEQQQEDIDKEKEQEKQAMQDKMNAMMNKAKEDASKFDIDDPDFKNIPEMHPATKQHTFEEWFELLYAVCDPKGLTDEECIEVIETRMGGTFLDELHKLKAKGAKLEKVEQHFLRKDKKAGYIFDKNDPDWQKIPEMTPTNKNHSFEDWFKLLYGVCDPKGLTDEECTDVMEMRMGGDYLNELQAMKADKADLEEIEIHFINKDKKANPQLNVIANKPPMTQQAEPKKIIKKNMPIKRERYVPRKREPEPEEEKRFLCRDDR